MANGSTTESVFIRAPQGRFTPGFNVDIPTELDPEDASRAVTSALERTISGRRDLLTSQTDLLGQAPTALQGLRTAVPEFGGAADVAQGVLSGASVQEDFGSAIQEALAVRGGGAAPGFNADLFGDQFFPQAAGLGLQTSLGQLPTAGISPLQQIDFGTIGGLNLEEARLRSQFEAGLRQTEMSVQLFNLMAQTLF